MLSKLHDEDKKLYKNEVENLKTIAEQKQLSEERLT